MFFENIRLKDTSQQNIYNISQNNQWSADAVGYDKSKAMTVNDREVINLLTWLAQEQGISPEVALKKAVVTAAYIHDITTSQGGKLLVKHKDNSVGEIVLN